MHRIRLRQDGDGKDGAIRVFTEWAGVRTLTRLVGYRACKGVGGSGDGRPRWARR